MKNTIKFLVAVLLLCTATVQAQVVSVQDLTCEHKKNPMGMDAAQPRFSWKLNAKGRDVVQTAYEIRVATEASFAASKIVWSSGKIASSESVLQRYAGAPLNSRQRYYWQVKVWDNKGKSTSWSPAAYWETGLMKASDWHAKWIEMEGDTTRYAPSPHFRKEFLVDKKVAKAVVYVTSHGFYELHLNGKKVGDQVLTPGWTVYGKRLQYQAYDVTTMLQNGKNAVGALLGDGWYKSTLAWGDNWAIYGKRLGLFMQLEITYADGTESRIITDETWKANNNGAVVMDDIYNGETYDATKRLTGWDKADYNDAAWQPVRIGDYSFNIVDSEGAEIRKIEELKPLKVFRSPKGSLIVDMGQNMIGWVRLKVSGTKGTKVVLRHAEILDKEGEFYTENLRSAKCQLTYTLSENGEEIYEPRFTFMGFRYVEVTGYPGTLTTDDITGVVIHSAMESTGTFESSDPMLNQLQHNIVWGQKGNFLDVPTDCPQRDERLGWTGDAQAFCRTAAFNFDVAAFFTKWLKDVALEQRPGGEIPNVIPDVLDPQGSPTTDPSAGWGDVAVIAPWTMYLVYGDKDLLERQYPCMKAWVEYIRKKSGERLIWKNGSVFGDWLFYRSPVNNHTEPDGHTDKDFIATAFYAYSTQLLAESAKALNKTEDAALYSDLYQKIKQVFIHEYVTPAGRVGTNSQTSYVLALMFGLVPDEVRNASAQFLVEDIKSRGNHLSTGFLGTPFLCHVLSNTGHTDVAYDLLLQKTYPSWLYPVTMGATTIWERWDGQKPDSTFQDASMNSFNHYSYGAIGDWMYRVSAGLETQSPGYKTLLLQPHPTDKLDYARASFDSPYGKTMSGWERKEGKMKFDFIVPANAKAKVVLPIGDASKVMENGKKLTDLKDVSNIQKSDGVTTFEIGSGSYHFECVE